MRANSLISAVCTSKYNKKPLPWRRLAGKNIGTAITILISTSPPGTSQINPARQTILYFRYRFRVYTTALLRTATR